MTVQCTIAHGVPRVVEVHRQIAGTRPMVWLSILCILCLVPFGRKHTPPFFFFFAVPHPFYFSSRFQDIWFRMVYGFICK